jgi:ElaB/YqjD/DUF883 family membrane-anchored ribosome-binding protein
MHNAAQPLPHNELADRVGQNAEHALHTTQRLVGQAEDLSRRGLERVRQAGTAVREQATRMGDQTVGYIKEEPLKAVLMAAAAGAFTALLVGWATRTRAPRD